jgi:YbgC/YbaW family acyl-CoA thioester hydrolase
MATHTLPFRIGWRHADPSEWIHYSNIFRFFEEAETSLLNGIGFSYQVMSEAGYAIPRVHVSNNFISPLSCFDEGTVTCRVKDVGVKSVTFEFIVEKVVDSARMVCGKGEIIGVTVNWKTRKGIPVPDDLRAALLSDYAGKTQWVDTVMEVNYDK